MGACATQTSKSIFQQSPNEILNTIDPLTRLEGKTRLRDYEEILGQKFALAVDQTTGRIPFQMYKLTGSNEFTVDLEINAQGTDLRSPKSIFLRLRGIDAHVCVPLSELKKFAASYFQVLPPSPFSSFAFTPRNRVDGPVVGVSLLQTGSCVNALGIYSTAKPDLWGH